MDKSDLEYKCELFTTVILSQQCFYKVYILFESYVQWFTE